MRSLTILIASLVIMVLGLWGSAVIYLDEDRLKGIVAEQMEQQIGRKLEIRGSLRVRFFPQLELRAEQVVVSGPSGFDGPELLEADYLSMSVRLLPLIRGGISAGEVNLSGATLNLHTNADGQSTFDGLTSTSAAPASPRRESDLLSTRKMRLEDVRLVVTDVSVGQSDTVMIEWIELDRFSFDQPLQFHFRGNVGEPPLFAEMTVLGQLYVPSTRHRPLRLTNMRMSGEMIGAGQSVTILGHLAVSPLPPLTFALDDGRLEIGDQAIAMTVSYDGRERGHLNMQASGRTLHWPLFAVTNGARSQGLLPFLRGMDIDATLGFDQLVIDQLSLEGVQAKVRAIEGLVEFEQIEGYVPGAVIQGGGWLDTQFERPRGELALRLDVDDAGQLLASLNAPAVLYGSGVSMMTLDLAGAPGGWQALDASGRFELWDGYWETSGIPDHGPPEKLHFSRLAGEYRLTPGHFALPELSLENEDLEALGWAAVDLEDYSVGGRLIVVADGREVEVSGTISSPRFSEPLSSHVEEYSQGEPARAASRQLSGN